MVDLIPSSLLRFPSFWDDDDWAYANASNTSGLAISEDDKNIYVEAAIPGIDPKDIEVTFDKGVVWIKGETKVEDKKDKKYYRRAASSFSYRVAVPGDIDQNVEPEASCKHGVMTVKFSKSPKSQPKKIAVKG
jgi:HSP20 family protein